MEEQTTKPSSNPITWVVLVIVVLALIIGGYFLFFQEETTNTNTVVVTNTTVNENTNILVNTNIEIDTSNWQVYTNEKYGYEVKYPRDATYRELSSGIEGNDDMGYMVDFTLGDLGIRITSSNNAGATTLYELVNSGVALFVSDRSEYEIIMINGKTAWKYQGSVQTEDGAKKVGVNSILLGENYYYQISTGNQFTPEFTSEREKIYDAFVSIFELK